MPRHARIDCVGVGGQLAGIQRRTEYGHAQTTSVIWPGVVVETHSEIDCNAAAEFPIVLREERVHVLGDVDRRWLELLGVCAPAPFASPVHIIVSRGRT